MAEQRTSEQSDAVISDCGRYRYRLWRRWADSGRMPVLWIMLNPSTADATENDPTIRRCIAFSKAWGYGAMWVGNLYAYRSTDPRELLAVADPIGPDNHRHLEAMSGESEKVICAWGARGTYLLAPTVLTPGGSWCFGRTQDGKPKHPLYLPSATPLQRWAA